MRTAPDLEEWLNDTDIKNAVQEAKLEEEAKHHLSLGMKPYQVVDIILQRAKGWGMEVGMTDIKRIVRGEVLRLAKNMMDCPLAEADPDMHLLHHVAEVRKRDGDVTYRFGIDGLDSCIGEGAYPAEIVLTVGAPGAMKTSLALTACDEYLSRTQGTILFFSLDLPVEELQTRRIMRVMGCNYDTAEREMKAGTSSYNDAREERNARDDGRFWLVGRSDKDDITWTMSRIEQECELRFPDIVVVDYVQTIQGYDDELKLTRDVAPRFKRLATRNKVIVHLLSQMSKVSRTAQRNGASGGLGMGGSHLEQLASFEVELLKEPALDGQMPVIVGSVPKTRRGVSGRSFALEYRGHTMEFTGRSQQVRRSKGGEPVHDVKDIVF